MFTGLLLRFQYEPFPGMAYDSVLYIQNEVFFGQMVRNIHHWSGMLLVIIVFMHLLRTFFTEAFHSPRHINWLLGVALLFTVIFSNFTGYLLPWDQLAYWAITVSTSMLQYFPVAGDQLMYFMRGGDEVGQATLLTFYNFHTGILPLTMILLMVYHFWKVRKAGGVVIPREDRSNQPVAHHHLEEMPKGQKGQAGNYVPTIPHLIGRELVVALVLIAFIMLLSIILNAPLLEKANPAFSPNPAKAPWYFAGIQELIMHFHPLFAVFIIPFLLVAGLVFIPYSRYDSDNSGTWFSSSKGKKISVISAITAFIITPLAVVADEYLPGSGTLLAGIQPVISNGLIPFLVVGLAGFGYYYFIRKKFKASKNEMTQAIFVLLTVSFIVLTLIGIWFRGEGMALEI